METVRLATHAMGTRFELALLGPDERALRAAGEEAIALIEDAHRRLTRFERGSVVSEINAAAGHGSVRVDDEVFELLQRCEAYRERSGGAFSVVRRAAGGNGQGDVLGLDPSQRRVALLAPGAFIDLGGVAKGFALDLAATALGDAGVRSALLHGGSSTIVAIGAPPGRDAWRIELDHADPGSPTPIVAMKDRALSLSSQAGDRPGHVLDPSTGETATGAPWAACIGESAEATDAWATALVVLGRRPDRAPEGLTTLLPGAPSSRLSTLGPDARAVTVPPSTTGAASTEQADE